jgi:acetyltransferase-like isoleucine patch superfamily enzyme
MDIPGTYRPRSRGAIGSFLRRGSRYGLSRVLPFESRTAELVAGLLDLPDDVVSMGRWSYFDGVPTIHRYPGAPQERVEIGAFCSLAKDVSFVLSGNHDAKRVTTSPVRKLFGVEGYDTSGEISGRRGISLGNDVWVGRGAIFLSGASVGDGAVIGARAVVSGTISPYAVVVGNPAQVVRRRFDDVLIDRLLASQWWEQPDEVLLAAVDLLSSHDVEAFLAHLDALASSTSE